MEKINEQTTRKVKSGGHKKIEPRWMPGESGNPKGRGKGVPSRSIFIKKILESKAIPPEQIVRDLKAIYPQYFERERKKWEGWETRLIMTIRLIQKVMDDGDTKAYELLMNYAYGKVKETFEGEIKSETILKVDKNIEQLTKEFITFLKKKS